MGAARDDEQRKEVVIRYKACAMPGKRETSLHFSLSSASLSEVGFSDYSLKSRALPGDYTTSVRVRSEQENGARAQEDCSAEDYRQESLAFEAASALEDSP